MPSEEWLLVNCSRRGYGVYIMLNMVAIYLFSELRAKGRSFIVPLKYENRSLGMIVIIPYQ